MDFLETGMLLEELLTLYTNRLRVSSIVVAQDSSGPCTRDRYSMMGLPKRNRAHKAREVSYPFEGGPSQDMDAHFTTISRSSDSQLEVGKGMGISVAFPGEMSRHQQIGELGIYKQNFSRVPVSM